jgi:hypothetical protein
MLPLSSEPLTEEPSLNLSIKTPGNIERDRDKVGGVSSQGSVS